MKRTPLLLACLVGAPAVFASGAQWDAESRWRYLSTQENSSYFLAYLKEFPDSPHADEARAWLETKQSAPRARLDTPACAAVLQERAESLLGVGRADLADDRYDRQVPPDHFLSSPTLVLVPRGARVDETPVEHRIELDLVARRDGECIVMKRWSHGSGLPEDCRCSPLDADYRFPSQRAEQVLKEYSQLRAMNDACVARGEPDRESVAQGYFSAAVARYRERLADPETPEAERAGYAEALEVLREPVVRADPYRVQKGVMDTATDAEQAQYCGRLPSRGEWSLRWL